MGERRKPRRGDVVFLMYDDLPPDPAIVMSVGGDAVRLGVIGVGGRFDVGGVLHRSDAPAGEWQWWCWPDEVDGG